MSIGIMFCYAKCWACNFGEHTQCALTWADDEDIEHAKATGQDWEKIAAQPCGCYCGGNESHSTEPESGLTSVPGS